MPKLINSLNNTSVSEKSDSDLFQFFLNSLHVFYIPYISPLKTKQLLVSLSKLVGFLL